LQKQSPIFHKTYTFLNWILERTQRFPKTQRFVLAKRLQDDILDFYDLIIFATKSKDSMQILLEADVKLELLRHHIRICVDQKLLTIRQYEYSSGHIAEIGRLLGGWMKSKKTCRQSQKSTIGSDSESSNSCVAGRFVEQQS